LTQGLVPPPVVPHEAETDATRRVKKVTVYIMSAPLGRRRRNESEETRGAMLVSEKYVGVPSTGRDEGSV